MNRLREYQAINIGLAAWQTCGTETVARVLGVTARGIFLLTPAHRILFVSAEPWRSPLTINLNRLCDYWRAAEIGSTAQLSTARLFFPAIEFAISLSADGVWQAPSPVLRMLSQTEQRTRLQSIVREVVSRRGHAGLVGLLPYLTELPDALALSVEQAALLERLLGIRRGVQYNDAARVLDGLTGLLGQGRGLTPSGDDVVMGWLLMAARPMGVPSSRRFQSSAGNENMLKHVATSIVTAAYQGTTAISANLIECAADGQGDERLIAVVDGIATGSTSIDECTECVLGWGSSSGIDALVGMALAITL